MWVQVVWVRPRAGCASQRIDCVDFKGLPPTVAGRNVVGTQETAQAPHSAMFSAGVGHDGFLGPPRIGWQVQLMEATACGSLAAGAPQRQQQQQQQLFTQQQTQKMVLTTVQYGCAASACGVPPKGRESGMAWQKE
jgi:hypothetical protein